MPAWEALIFVELGAVLLALFVCWLANLVTTDYLHRYLTHKSWVIYNPKLILTFRILVWMLTGLKPREWVAVHRNHHANTDKRGDPTSANPKKRFSDPHSPHLVGLKEVELHDAKLYRAALQGEDNDSEAYVTIWAPDVLVDDLDVRFFDHGWRGLSIAISLAFILWLTVCGLVFGANGLLYGLLAGLTTSLVHFGLYIFLGGCVNGAGHWRGGARFRNLARNRWLLAVVTCGEGFHNNHHGRQESARLWASWGELPAESGYWFIALFCKLNWADLGEHYRELELKPRLNLPRSSREQLRSVSPERVAA